MRACPNAADRHGYAQTWQQQAQQLSIARTQSRVYGNDGVYRWFAISLRPNAALS